MQKGFYTNISLSFSRSIELCFLWFRALFSLSTNIAFPDVILSLPPAEAKITKKPSGCQYFFYLLQIARDGRNDEEEDKRTNSQTHHQRREKNNKTKRDYVSDIGAGAIETKIQESAKRTHLTTGSNCCRLQGLETWLLGTVAFAFPLHLQNSSRGATHNGAS